MLLDAAGSNDTVQPDWYQQGGPREALSQSRTTIVATKSSKLEITMEAYVERAPHFARRKAARSYESFDTRATAAAE